MAARFVENKSEKVVVQRPLNQTNRRKEEDGNSTRKEYNCKRVNLYYLIFIYNYLESSFFINKLY